MTWEPPRKTVDHPDRLQRIGDMLIVVVMGVALAISLGLFGAAYIIWVVHVFG